MEGRLALEAHNLSTVKYLLKTLMKCQKLQKQGTMIERDREIVGEKESLGSVQAKSN
jgi:hypothetical protein